MAKARGFLVLAFQVPNSPTVAFGFIRSGKSYTVSKGLTSREPRGRSLKMRLVYNSLCIIKILTKTLNRDAYIPMAKARGLTTNYAIAEDF